MAKYLIVRIVLGEHHSIPNMVVVLGKKNAGLGTANLVKVHLVNGLNGAHAMSPVDMEDTKNVRGSALVNTAV